MIILQCALKDPISKGTFRLYKVENLRFQKKKIFFFQKEKKKKEFL